MLEQPQIKTASPAPIALRSRVSRVLYSDICCKPAKLPVCCVRFRSGLEYVPLLILALTDGVMLSVSWEHELANLEHVLVLVVI